MPNRQRHVEIGLVIALVVIVVLVAIDDERRRFVLEHVGAGLSALAGSVAPDVLEPATTPNHRKLFHSVVALAGTGAAALDPSDRLLQWRERLWSAAESARRQRVSLPRGHSRRANLWFKECAYHMAAGASIGFPVGYGAHLIADSDTPDGLPTLG